MPRHSREESVTGIYHVMLRGVNRQGDEATTRATYTDNGGGTGSLAFSSGDKLFVHGYNYTVDGAGEFAGTLEYDGEGKFSGTITTENLVSITADALFTAASDVNATLLPNGYESIGFLNITLFVTSSEQFSKQINHK